MNPEDIVPGWRDVPQLILGLGIFLLPGIAAADRLLPESRLRWVLAPVLSFTLLPVAAILLNFAAGLKATPATTALLAFSITLLFAAPRIVRWLDLEVAS